MTKTQNRSVENTQKLVGAGNLTIREEGRYVTKGA